tara:strand:- start:234 stop:572 length:339 start_codon:yes stop_codon:yes gene_type:complete
MKKTTLFLLIILTSCSNNEKDNLKNIIPINNFTKIIKEIHLIEANYELNKFKNKELANKILQNNYDSIFKKNLTDYDAFKISLNHYSLSDDQLQIIYGNAIEELKNEKSQLE